MNMNDEEYKRIKAEKEAELDKKLDRDYVLQVVSIIIAPPIFFGLKYVYSLLL